MKMNKRRKNPILRILLTVAMVMPVALAPAHSFAQDRNVNAVEIFQPLSDPLLLRQKTAAAANASYSVRVRFDELQTLETGRDVRLRYSATEQWEGRIQRVERRSNESFTLFGKIDSSHEGWFIFTIEGGVIVASIQIPELNLLADLRNIRDDSFWLYFFDSRERHPFTCGVTEKSDLHGDVLTSMEAPVVTFAEGASPAPQQDIMVLYTQGLLNDFPNHFPNTPLETAIQHFVDFANQAYINSGVQLRLRLAYRGLVAGFSEAGRSREWLLSNLAGKNDGYLDYIHSWRTLYHADLVCLLYSIETQALNGGGLSNVLGQETFNTGDPAAWYNSAFCVVEGLWEPSTMEPPISGMVPNEFVHEIGHNQGLGHNCEDGGGDIRSFAYGWRFIGNSGTKYVTIMAYADDDYASATLLPNFSNPSVYFDGKPTGNSTTAGCSGTTGARNAEALNLTADFMSRMHLNPLDPWVDFNYTGTTQNGRFEAPWKTLWSAINNLPQTTATNTPEPPTITFKGPTSSGPLSITINKRVTLKAHGGAVTIGRSL